MLSCVCRPVSGNLPKMPPSMMPALKPTSSSSPTHVVTTEPKLNVPSRLTSAELRAMALRQQQQIDSQHQLLATKEQRLRFLKSQEVRSAVASAEGERLRRLRERVEAQESKLRRLRALRGQVDLQKTYNVTLSNDLDSIRALFSEKEKELSLAVAKVEALTRQLEDLRRDRRCPVNMLTSSNGTAAQTLPPQASRELEKLRRELMYRNQLSMQQDARLHMQREALQQRQAELRSVDQRIYELQTRLQRKRQANIQMNNIQQQQQQHQQQQQQQQQQLHAQSAQLLATSAQQQIQLQLQQQQQQQQQLQKQQHKQQQQQSSFGNDLSQQQTTNLAKHGGVAALKQQLLQKQVNQLAAAAAAAAASNIVGQSRANERANIARGNVAAVEPFIHTPQKSTITTTASYLSGGNANILKHAAATANTNQQNQLIQDMTHVKMNLANAAQLSATSNAFFPGSSNTSNNSNNTSNVGCESDESKLAKKLLTAKTAAAAAAAAAATAAKTEADSRKQAQLEAMDSTTHIYAEVGPKKRDRELLKEAAAAAAAAASAEPVSHGMATTLTAPTSKIPKSIASGNAASALISKLNQQTKEPQEAAQPQKKNEIAVTSETLLERNTHQLTVHSMPLGAISKSVAMAVSNSPTTVSNTAASHSTTATSNTTSSVAASHMESLLLKPKPLQAGNSSLAVPPRKPISSVAPTSVTSAIPKMIPYSPKVNRVAPNVVVSASELRPALPPKPSKMSPTEQPAEPASTTALGGANARKSEANSFGLQSLNINDNLPIKAKPLTIRKQPLFEQPRLKSSQTSSNLGSNVPKPSLSMQPARNLDLTVPSSSNAPIYADVKPKESARAQPQQLQQQHPIQQPMELAKSSPDQAAQHSPTGQHSPNSNSQSGSSIDEPDRCSQQTSEAASNTIKEHARANPVAKPKLGRRVSFDPLALLLDASLEGELELVKKTAMQVANASAANDEGITALHNAICAGHIDIVKFLVQFGCDVNAQDSDGWTPLHCAASCNNLSMVKFLVESGACLFASTLSDHETPAEKCEEDEEGFDGCSEYLYSIQEKLGILHNGDVYAVFSYEAQNSDELTFHVNEPLIILRKGDDAENEWWWARNSSNKEGYVPRNLLGLYPRVAPQSPHFND